MLAPARVAIGAVAALAYVGASHWLMTAASASPWNAVALLAPMLMLLGHIAWRARRYLAFACALAVLLALALNAGLGHAMAERKLYLTQHVAIHLCLAALFGLSLRRDAQALISGVAQRVHGFLTPDMARYTRNLTWVWTVYFIAMAGGSMAIYAILRFEDWALFANWLTPFALALMFGGEHLLRYRLHPEFERVSMARAIAAYTQRSSPEAASHNSAGLAKP